MRSVMNGPYLRDDLPGFLRVPTRKRKGPSFSGDVFVSSSSAVASVLPSASSFGWDLLRELRRPQQKEDGPGGKRIAAADERVIFPAAEIRGKFSGNLGDEQQLPCCAG